MGKRNARNAGRKPQLNEKQIEEIKNRIQNGEKITALALEYHISRQTLSTYIHKPDNNIDNIYYTYRKWVQLNRKFKTINIADYTMRMDYMCRDELCTVILINFKDKDIAVENETEVLIHRAFGIKAKPDWKDFEEFLESRCFPRTRDCLRSVLRDVGVDFYDPLAIVEKTKGRMAEDLQWVKITYLAPISTEGRNLHANY